MCASTNLRAWRLLLFLGVLAILVQAANAASPNVTFNLADFTSVSVKNKQVDIFPLSAPLTNNGVIILSDKKTYQSSSAGSFVVTNMIPGCYLVRANGAWTMTPFSVCFSNLSGNLNAADFFTIAPTVVAANQKFVQHTEGILTWPSNFLSANIQASLSSGITYDILGGKQIGLRLTNVVRHDGAGVISSPANFFSLNVTPGTNVVFVTNGLGQITISSTGGGGPPGVLNPVTHDGAGAILSPATFFTVNVTPGTNVVFITNGSSQLSISSKVPTNFLALNLLIGTNVVFETNGAGQVTISARVPTNFLSANLLKGTNVVFETNGLGQVTISGGDGGAVLNPVTHDGSGVISSPVNFISANVLAGTNVILATNGLGQVTISSSASGGGTTNAVTHDGSGALLSPTNFLHGNIFKGANITITTNALGQITIAGAAATVNPVTHDGAGVISTPANFIHANVLQGTNISFATNGLGKVTISGVYTNAVLHNGAGVLLGPTNFFHANILKGSQITFTTNALGQITIGTTGLGAATNAIEILNGVGTNTSIFASGVGSVPLTVTGFPSGTVNLLSVSTPTQLRAAVSSTGSFQVYTTRTDDNNYERLSLANNSISMQTAGTGADDLSLFVNPAGAGRVIIGNALVTTNLILQDTAGSQEHSFTLANIAGNLSNKLWTTNPVSNGQLLAANTDGSMFWTGSAASLAYTNNIEIWLSPRTDLDGDGSVQNPRRADTVAAFDGIMRAYAAASNITFRLHPGQYLTQGFCEDQPAGTGWQMGRNWRIWGAGIDKSILTITNTIGGSAVTRRFYHVIGSDHDIDSSYSEVSDLTIDCNLDNLTYPTIAGTTNVYRTIAACKLNGSHTAIRRIKAIHYGADGLEIPSINDDVFVISAAATFPQHAPRGSHTVIEDCIMLYPSKLTTDNIVEFIHTSGAMNIANDLMAFTTNIIIRNNYIDGRFEDGTIKTRAFNPDLWHGLTAGSCDLGLVEGNTVLNLDVAGCYQDSFRTRSIMVRNNLFQDVDAGGLWTFTGQYGEPAGAVPATDGGLAITSITSGAGLTTATLTTAQALHDFLPGIDVIQVLGVTGAGDQVYNGDFVVLTATANTLTYQMTAAASSTTAPGGAAKLLRVHRGVRDLWYTGNTTLLRHGDVASYGVGMIGFTDRYDLPIFHNVLVANNYFGFSDGKPTNNVTSSKVGVYVRNAKNAIVRDNTFNLYTNLTASSRNNIYVRNNSNFVVFNNRQVDGVLVVGYDGTSTEPPSRWHDFQASQSYRIYETNGGSQYFEISAGVMATNVLGVLPTTNGAPGQFLTTDGGHPAKWFWGDGGGASTTTTFPDGSAAAPSIARTVDPTDGIYFGSDLVHFAIGGVKAASVGIQNLQHFAVNAQLVLGPNANSILRQTVPGEFMVSSNGIDPNGGIHLSRLRFTESIGGNTQTLEFIATNMISSMVNVWPATNALPGQLLSSKVISGITNQWYWTNAVPLRLVESGGQTVIGAHTINVSANTLEDLGSGVATLITSGITIREPTGDSTVVTTLNVTDGTLSTNGLPVGEATLTITGGGSGIPVLNGTGTELTVTNNLASDVPLRVQSVASQSAALQTWSSSVAPLSQINADGKISLPAGTAALPSITRQGVANEGIALIDDITRFTFNGATAFDISPSGVSHLSDTAYFSFGLTNDVRMSRTRPGWLQFNWQGTDGRGSIAASNITVLGTLTNSGPVTYPSKSVVFVAGVNPRGLVDGSLGNYFTHTLTASTNLYLTNMVEGPLTVVITNPSLFTVTWLGMKTNQWLGTLYTNQPVQALSNVTYWTFYKIGNETNGSAVSRGIPITPYENLVFNGTSQNLDFGSNPEQVLTVTGNMAAITTSGKVEGIRSISVLIINAAGAKTVTAVPSWRWMTPSITNGIADNTRNVLTLKSYNSPDDTGVQAWWNPQL